MIYPNMLQQHTSWRIVLSASLHNCDFCISSSSPACPANAVDMNPALTTGCSSEGDDPARNDRLNGRQRRFVANLSSIRGEGIEEGCNLRRQWWLTWSRSSQRWRWWLHKGKRQKLVSSLRAMLWNRFSIAFHNWHYSGHPDPEDGGFRWWWQHW